MDIDAIQDDQQTNMIKPQQAHDVEMTSYVDKRQDVESMFIQC